MTGEAGSDNRCPIKFYYCLHRDRYGDCPFEYPSLPPECEKPCALGVFETLISAEDRRYLMQDTYDKGYKAVAIEFHNVSLNKADMFIELEDGLTQSLKKETNKGKFLPLPCKSISHKSQHRASEFNKMHHCQRIFSKIDHKKLGFLDGVLSRVGTAYHAICNQQHRDWIQENDLLKELGIEPVSRKTHCEIGLRYHYKDLVVSAHADEILQYLPNTSKFGSDIGAPCVLDMKRKAYSIYEEYSYLMQLTANILGVEEMHKTNSGYFYLITAKRPRREVIGRYRLPEYHITKIAKNGSIIKQFHSELIITNVEQSELLNDKLKWEKNKALLTDVGDCTSCFDKDACNYTTKTMCEKKITARETLEDVLKAVLPNKELPGT